MTSAPAHSVTRLLGTTPTARAATWWTRRRLRVLAYHEVRDARRFAHHLEYLRRQLVPVDAEAIVAAQRGERDLPERAVWVTFDDGYPDVLEEGGPVLDRYQIRATLFVCPHAIESGESLWWQQVDAALALGRPPWLSNGRDGPGLVTRLKHVPDRDRRRVVHRIAEWASDQGVDVTRAVRQMTVGDLRAWQRAGHDLGNHTWDHPCLPRCSAEEQRRQIEDADRWLRRHTARQVALFAYPNGDHDQAAEQVLLDNGYAVGVLFDHHLSAPDRHPLRTSRLRVSADAELERFRAIVSGGHSVGAAAAARLRRPPPRRRRS